MNHVIYTPQSLADFEAILRYVAEQSNAAAVKLGEGLLRTCEHLDKHPRLGEQQDKLAPGIRRLTYRGYSVFYRIDSDPEVVRVLRMLPPGSDVRSDSF